MPNKCCCCTDLRSGTLMITTLHFVFALLLVGLALLTIFFPQFFHESVKPIYPYMWLSYGAIALVMSVVGLIGVSANRLRFASYFSHYYAILDLLFYIGVSVATILLAVIFEPQEVYRGCQLTNTNTTLLSASGVARALRAPAVDCNIEHQMYQLAGYIVMGIVAGFGLVHVYFSMVVYFYGKNFRQHPYMYNAPELKEPFGGGSVVDFSTKDDMSVVKDEGFGLDF